MAVLLALCAALSNALATVMQRIGVESAPDDARSSKRLCFATFSFLLQAVALSLGALSTVQPVMVTELVFLLAVLGFYFRRPLGWGEWIGAGGTAIGLGIFLSVSAPAGGSLRPDVTSWGMVLGAAAVGICLSLFMTRVGSRSWRAAWFGAAGGIAFALTAALIKVSSDYVNHQGFDRLFTHWQPYSIAVAGLIGLILTQHALQAGPIAASQSSLLIVNPLASILMGTLLFGDRLQTSGGRIVVDSLALTVMFVGLVVLSHSPTISSPTAEERLSTGRDRRVEVAPKISRAD
jgi:drug/metabolite transporter (DMT)-like permease